jgi:hypothetical protein
MRSALGDAEPRDDLVEEQQRAVAIRDRAKALEKTRRRRDDPHVGGDRLDRDHRDALRVRGEEGFDRGEVVVARGQREAGERRGHTGRAGNAERRDA